MKHNGRSNQLFLERIMKVAARTLNGDKVMNLRRLGSGENFVGK